MFKLVTIEDTIQVPPRYFGYPRLKALEHAINKRLSDKVVPGIGLCIAFWDWVTVGEDSLRAQTGEASTKCVFRIVVFAPFQGEAIFGRVSGACANGLFVELGFFDAIVVPKIHLPRPSEFDEKERVWIWKPEFEGEQQTFFQDVSNETVFRTKQILYDDQTHVPPAQREVEGRNPMSIIGALYDDVIEDSQGLGDPLWWYEEEEAEGDGEEYNEMQDDGNDANAGDEMQDEEVEGDEEATERWEEDDEDGEDGEEGEGEEYGGKQEAPDASKSELRLHD